MCIGQRRRRLRPATSFFRIGGGRRTRGIEKHVLFPRRLLLVHALRPSAPVEVQLLISGHRFAEKKSTALTEIAQRLCQIHRGAARKIGECAGRDCLKDRPRRTEGKQSAKEAPADDACVAATSYSSSAASGKRNDKNFQRQLFITDSVINVIYGDIISRVLL